MINDDNATALFEDAKEYSDEEGETYKKRMKTFSLLMKPLFESRNWMCKEIIYICTRKINSKGKFIIKRRELSFNGSVQDDKDLYYKVINTIKTFRKENNFVLPFSIVCFLSFLKEGYLYIKPNLKCSHCQTKSITANDDYMVCYLCSTQKKEFYLCDLCIKIIVNEEGQSIHEHPLLLVPKGSVKKIKDMKFPSVYNYCPNNTMNESDKSVCTNCKQEGGFFYWSNMEKTRKDICSNCFKICKKKYID